MDRPDRNDSVAQACTCACAHGPTGPLSRGPAASERARLGRWQRALAVATVAAGLMVGLNALVQAVNVLAAWWRHAG